MYPFQRAVFRSSLSRIKLPWILGKARIFSPTKKNTAGWAAVSFCSALFHSCRKFLTPEINQQLSEHFTGKKKKNMLQHKPSAQSWVAVSSAILLTHQSSSGDFLNDFVWISSLFCLRHQNFFSHFLQINTRITLWCLEFPNFEIKSRQRHHA